MQIGAHKSAAGGYVKAAERVSDIGGTCLQIFSTSPRTWRVRDVSDEEVTEFKAAREELEIDPVYFHACYLTNLADRGATGEKSVKNLIAELTLAERLGVRGSVIHTGSYKTDDGGPEDDAHYQTLLDNLRAILDEMPDESLLILENSGNRKIGRDPFVLGQIIEDAGGNERLKVCLDTCHLHAAGYDISTEEKFTDFFSEFDDKVGLDRLELIHTNDSRDEFGSLRDRHANIGEGEIPESVFQLLLTRPETKDLPFILEVPGSGNGPDPKNLERLKVLAQG